MRYEKLRLNIPGAIESVENWYLILSNWPDLLKYAEIDAELDMQAMLHLEKSGNEDWVFDTGHAGDNRQKKVGTMLNLRALSAKEGEKLYPIIELGKQLDAKTQGMFKTIQRYGAICVNVSGGYCPYNHFKQIWKAEIVDVVEKEDVGFPIEKAALSCETIIIENQDDVYSGMVRAVEKETRTKAVVISNLKEKDRTWVGKSLANAKNIALMSHFQDHHQVDAFMSMFTKLPKKNVLIFCSARRRSRLTNHRLWDDNNSRHNIKFFDTNNL